MGPSAFVPALTRPYQNKHFTTSHTIKYAESSWDDFPLATALVLRPIVLDRVRCQSMHDLDENAERVVRRFVHRGPANLPQRP